jgi:putative protease
MTWKPELLAPAKNLERLKVAVSYGADAVYLGGPKYGLRARADNFTDSDLRRGVAFAHRHHARVYVTLNAFLHDADFNGLDAYCRFLESTGVDAVIVSDAGVIRAVRDSSDLAIHLSTQASCLNGYAARLWKEFGVRRLILGRELSIAEAGAIREQAAIDVEMFVHGAMCMAYSGHCTISNFTAGRDSNRGGCVQSCRFPYQLQNADHDQSAATAEPVTFMSSRDLWGIHQIGDFFRHRICSLKIEGRMKSSFYVAMTCKAYRLLIDAYAERQSLDQDLLQQTARQLQSTPHRDYCSGSLSRPAAGDSVFDKLDGINTGTHQYLGLVLDSDAEHIVVRLFMPLALGDEIEILPFRGEPVRCRVEQLRSVAGETIASMRQDSVVCIPRDTLAASADGIIDKLNVVRIAQAA